MNQDMKIGLALGVLLLGIVGAFFFRNESDPTQPPPIEGTAELDKQIAEKEFVPYLTGVEVFDSERSEGSSQPKVDVAGRAKTEQTTRKAIDLDVPDFLQDESEPSQRLAARPAPPPDPISIEPGDSLAPAEPHSASKPTTDVVARSQKPSRRTKAATRRHAAASSGSLAETGRPTASSGSVQTPGAASRNSERASVAPRHNNAWQVVDEPAPASSPDASGRKLETNQDRRSQASVTGRFRTHRVRKGETLSALAQRYLGDSRRFLELFEANRHLLKDPDDLKAGMVIRIPVARPSTTRGVPAASSRRDKTTRESSPHRPNNQPDPAPRSRSLKDLFQPVPHTPLNPGRRIPAAASPRRTPSGRR